MVSFEDAVHKRTSMYFGVDRLNPEIATNVLRVLIDDALHPIGGGRHHSVEVDITSDLGFCVADDEMPDCDERGRPRLGFYNCLIPRSRWALAGAAALSTRTVIEVRTNGRGYRQRLDGTEPAREPESYPARPGHGTRACFELDAAVLAPGAVVSRSLGTLGPAGNGCDLCSGRGFAELAAVTDHRAARPGARA